MGGGGGGTVPAQKQEDEVGQSLDTLTPRDPSQHLASQVLPGYYNLIFGMGLGFLLFGLQDSKGTLRTGLCSLLLPPTAAAQSSPQGRCVTATVSLRAP